MLIFMLIFPWEARGYGATKINNIRIGMARGELSDFDLYSTSTGVRISPGLDHKSEVAAPLSVLAHAKPITRRLPIMLARSQYDLGRVRHIDLVGKSARLKA